MGHLVYETYKGIEQITVRGVVTPALVAMLLAQQLAASGRYIIDLRKADFERFTAADVASIVRMARTHGLPGPNVRVALLAESLATFGLCRMFQLTMDSNDGIGVHSTQRAAADWLKLDALVAA
jgi:hypothetical protein